MCRFLAAFSHLFFKLRNPAAAAHWLPCPSALPRSSHRRARPLQGVGNQRRRFRCLLLQTAARRAL